MPVLGTEVALFGAVLVVLEFCNPIHFINFYEAIFAQKRRFSTFLSFFSAYIMFKLLQIDQRETLALAIESGAIILEQTMH